MSTGKVGKVGKVGKRELARTDHFPAGSVGRSYLIRLPLDENGLIDEAARSADPGWATIRRFWPNEVDLSGYVLRGLSEGGDESLCHLANHPIRQGENPTVTEANGDQLPFRIAAVHPAQ